MTNEEKAKILSKVVWEMNDPNYQISIDKAAGPDQSGYLKVEFDKKTRKFTYTPISREEFYNQ